MTVLIILTCVFILIFVLDDALSFISIELMGVFFFVGIMGLIFGWLVYLVHCEELPSQEFNFIAKCDERQCLLQDSAIAVIVEDYELITNIDSATLIWKSFECNALTEDPILIYTGRLGTDSRRS